MTMQPTDHDTFFFCLGNSFSRTSSYYFYLWIETAALLA